MISFNCFRLAMCSGVAARLIQLRYAGGLSIEDAAEMVDISRSTAYEHWSFRMLVAMVLGLVVWLPSL
jgi:hypothetical protein